MKKKILVVGATGAMGVYLIPELLNMGYTVDGVSVDDIKSDNKDLRYIKADATDIGFLSILLQNKYDGIVDFMIYPDKKKFETYMRLFLDNTKHYIYLSTYRIYAESEVISEKSPRLLDVCDDKSLLSTGDYAIYKAECENELRVSKYTNYTIVRPAITYSKRRFQLTTLEANVLIYRMFENRTVVLPEGAKNVQATMSWAGDVAKMIVRLLFNEKAYTQTYSVCTSEHKTWGEIADIYNKIYGLKCVWVNDEDYIDIVGGSIAARNQLIYDRELNRVMDNSKILEATGMKQSELMPLEKGLSYELSRLKKDDIIPNININNNMDKYLTEHKDTKIC